MEEDRVDIKELVQVYSEYYKCSNKKCASHYHLCNFTTKEFSCRDCGTISIVPSKALPQKKQQTKRK